MDKIIYDFEVFNKLWLVVLYNYDTKQEFVIINDRDKLIDFYKNNKDNCFIGYNNNHYDQYIFKGILLNQNPYVISKKIIEDKQGWFEFLPESKNIFMINYDLSNRLNSLKQLEGFMGSDIEECDISFDKMDDFTQEEIEIVLKYCKHDVKETVKVFEHFKSDFESHVLMIETFDMPLEYFNKTQAQLSAMILESTRPKSDRNDDFDITIVNTLNLKKYSFVENWYRDVSNLDYKNELVCEIANVPHVFAFGGIHGALNGYVDDGVFIMSDIALTQWGN